LGTHLPCVFCHLRFNGVATGYFAPVPDLPAVPAASEAPGTRSYASPHRLSIRGPPVVV
jgi:hypothetical protein